MREWARSESTVAAAVRASDQQVRRRGPAGLPRCRLRPRAGRDARHRDIRRRHRLPASVRFAAQPVGRRAPRGVSGSHAAALTSVPLSIPKGMVGSEDDAPQTSHPEVSADFVARLADRAGEAEKLRRLPQATVDDYRDSGLARLLLPKRYGGSQAEFPEILEVVRLMAHGCTSSAWTLGFYTLHNWMLALFGERAQDEVFADGPVLCPAPLAPTGRAVPDRRRRAADRAVVVGNRDHGRRLGDGRRHLRTRRRAVSGAGVAAGERRSRRRRLAHRRHVRHRIQRRHRRRRVGARASTGRGDRHLRRHHAGRGTARRGGVPVADGAGAGADRRDARAGLRGAGRRPVRPAAQ